MDAQAEWLIRTKPHRQAPAREGAGKPRSDGLAVLSVIVIEERQLSTPERLILTLESVDGLYRACAQILGEFETSIAVSACDSGSDKSFDFLGIASVVVCVKEVVLSFWDKVVYFREDKTGRRLELIAESLPILERVAKMRESTPSSLNELSSSSGRL